MANSEIKDDGGREPPSLFFQGSSSKSGHHQQPMTAQPTTKQSPLKQTKKVPPLQIKTRKVASLLTSNQLTTNSSKELLGNLKKFEAKENEGRLMRNQGPLNSTETYSEIKQSLKDNPAKHSRFRKSSRGSSRKRSKFESAKGSAYQQFSKKPVQGALRPHHRAKYGGAPPNASRSKSRKKSAGRLNSTRMTTEDGKKRPLNKQGTKKGDTIKDEEITSPLTYKLKLINSEQISVGTHIYPDQTHNDEKHKYDFVYQKVFRNRLQRQWQQGVFNQIDKIKFQGGQGKSQFKKSTRKKSKKKSKSKSPRKKSASFERNKPLPSIFSAKKRKASPLRASVKVEGTSPRKQPKPAKPKSKFAVDGIVTMKIQEGERTMLSKGKSVTPLRQSKENGEALPPSILRYGSNERSREDSRSRGGDNRPIAPVSIQEHFDPGSYHHIQQPKKPFFMEKSIVTGSVGSSVLSGGAKTKSKKSSKRARRYHTFSSKPVLNPHLNVQSKAHDLQQQYFDPQSQKKVEKCLKQYEKEKDNIKRCKYHQQIEEKVRVKIGWDKERWWTKEAKVDATHIMQKDLEDYLFNNGAKDDLCKHLTGTSKKSTRRQEALKTDISQILPVEDSKTLTEPSSALHRGNQLLHWNPFELEQPFVPLPKKKEPEKPTSGPLSDDGDEATKDDTIKIIDREITRMNRDNSEFKQRWNLMKHGDGFFDEECQYCQIEGCRRSVANSEDAPDSEDSSEENSSQRSPLYSISNATSFSDFYVFKEEEVDHCEAESIPDPDPEFTEESQGLKDAENTALGFRYMPDHKFKRHPQLRRNLQDILDHQATLTTLPKQKTIKANKKNQRLSLLSRDNKRKSGILNGGKLKHLGTLGPARHKSMLLHQNSHTWSRQLTQTNDKTKQSIESGITSLSGFKNYAIKQDFWSSSKQPRSLTRSSVSLKKKT